MDACPTAEPSLQQAKPPEETLDFSQRWRAPRLQKRSTSLDSGDWDEQGSNRSLCQPSPCSSHSSWSRLPEEDENVCRLLGSTSDMTHSDLMDLSFHDLSSSDIIRPFEREGSISPGRKSAMMEQYRQVWQLRATFEEQDDDEDDVSSVILDFSEVDSDPHPRSLALPMVEEKCWKYLDTLKLEQQGPPPPPPPLETTRPEEEPVPVSNQTPPPRQEEPSCLNNELTSRECSSVSLGGTSVSTGVLADDEAGSTMRSCFSSSFDRQSSIESSISSRPAVSRTVLSMFRDSSFDSVDTEDSSTSDVSRFCYAAVSNNQQHRQQAPITVSTSTPTTREEPMNESTEEGSNNSSRNNVEISPSTATLVCRPHPYRMRHWRVKRRGDRPSAVALDALLPSPADVASDLDTASPSPSRSPSREGPPRPAHASHACKYLAAPCRTIGRRYVRRDYSIDKHSDKLFREFSKYDPVYDLVRRPKSTKEHNLRSSSLGSSRRRPPPRSGPHLTPQDSIEEEEEAQHDSSKVSRLSTCLK